MNGGARYCSNACRQRAYRLRTRSGSATSAGPTGTELPHQLDCFVGREDELTGIARLLRNGRLITLLGPAGAGKSRIASELAARVQRRYEHGVRVVDLGGLTGVEPVGQRVAAAIGIAEQPGTSLVDTVTAELHGKELLLVLDNCEHLVRGCGELVVQLLRRCGGLRALVTSREVLQLPGEMIYPIGELPLADAVQLFVERARAVAPGFADPGTGERHAELELICTRLDCLPFAVELAARLVRLLPLADIIAGLDDRFAMLAATTRGFDTRHRDLRAALEWSYELLEPAEQALFRRLSVLPGGFAIDLAAAVGDTPTSSMVPLMSSLESKSVIAASADCHGRFRQLESVRYYAGRKLDEAGERAKATERLVDWLTGIAEPLTRGFTTSGATLDRLDSELSNLLTGVEYLRGGTDDRLLLLESALARCRQRLGIAADGRERLASALRIPDASATYRAFAWEQASWLAGWYDAHRESAEFARQAVATGAEHGNAALLGRALQALGFAEQVHGDYPAATSSFARCLSHVRTLDEPMSVGLCLNNLAWAHILDGDLDGAGEALTEAAPIYRKHGEPVRRAALLHTNGVLALRRDDVATSANHFVDSLRSLPDRGSMIWPYAVEGLAVGALRGGDVERGLRLAGLAEVNRSGVGDPWWRDLVSLAVADARARVPERRASALLDEGRTLSQHDGERYALTGEWPTGPAADADLPLTGRQFGVATLLVEGLTNRQIAGRLRISERTVETHLDHIRTRLDLRSRAQVAAWAATRQSVRR